MKKLAPLMFILLFPGAAWAATEKEQVEKLIRDTADGVLLVARQAELTRDQKIEKIMAIVTPVFDLPLMAKLTLGRENWAKLDDKQKKEFTDLFIEQLQVTYSDQIELHSEGRIEYVDAVKTGNKYSLLTVAHSKDQQIKLAYKLYKSPKGWKVYDVEIEDVSLVRSYNNQYGQILQEKSPAVLLEKLREKIVELKKAPAAVEPALSTGTAPAAPATPAKKNSTPPPPGPK